MGWQQNRLYADEASVIAIRRQISGPTQQNSLDSAETPAEGFQDLLSDAARYSIRDVEALDFESAVTSRYGRGTRLVEKARFQFDYELWAILLRYRMRAYGDTGIRIIWKFLSRRDRVGLVPVHWPMEDSLWRIFIGLGIRDHEFLGHILKYTQQLWRERQIRRESLYVEIVGGLLRTGNHAAAPEFSKRMNAGVFTCSKDLVDLFFAASTSPDCAALESFRHVCDTIPNHKLYGDIVPTLCERGRGDEALMMHTYLLRRHDMPLTFEAIEPLVGHIAQSGLELSAFSRQLEEAGVSFGGRMRKHYDSVRISELGGISREDVDRATNKTFGVKRSKISDKFAARFFATKSFSFELALMGLYMLGLEELGPLSLREIALRSANASIIRERLTKLQSMKIDTGGSAYSRVIKKLAWEQEDSLLMDVVLCDQHPDVFENQQVQLQLLKQYQESKDWRQVNRTLAILDVFGASKQYSQNGLLRGTLIRKDWPEINQIAGQILEEGSHISQANISLMYQLIFRDRPASRRKFPENHGYKDLKFLVTIWQANLKSGNTIPADAWREPLRCLGVMGKWMDLEKTCHWLCSWYSSQGIDSFRDNCVANGSILPFMSMDQKHLQYASLAKLFSSAFQSSIVEWGFGAGFKRLQVSESHETCHLNKSVLLQQAPWARGIELLCSLRRCYGVQLDEAAIQSACQQQLRSLFSRGGRSEIRHSREARSMNRVKLHTYLHWINKTYGGVLLDPHDARIMSNILTAKPLRIVVEASSKMGRR